MILSHMAPSCLNVDLFQMKFYFNMIFIKNCLDQVLGLVQDLGPGPRPGSWTWSWTKSLTWSWTWSPPLVANMVPKCLWVQTVRYFLLESITFCVSDSLAPPGFVESAPPLRASRVKALEVSSAGRRSILHFLKAQRAVCAICSFPFIMLHSRFWSTSSLEKSGANALPPCPPTPTT